MKMLYTANGRYIRCCTEEGSRPVIIVCEKEYEVDVQESTRAAAAARSRLRSSARATRVSSVGSPNISHQRLPMPVVSCEKPSE